MATSSGMHTLSRLQEKFFLLVAKLHLYEYEDYTSCKMQNSFGKVLPELTEEDFDALRACELYGTYEDWVDYHLWSSVPYQIPAHVREREVSFVFAEHNPNLFDMDVSEEAECATINDVPFVEIQYVKERWIRATRIKNRYRKDKKHTCDINKLLEAKYSAWQREYGYSEFVEAMSHFVALLHSNATKEEIEAAQIQVYMLFKKMEQPKKLITVPGEDSDGATFIRRTIHIKSSPETKYLICSSSHKGLLDNYQIQAERQRKDWMQDYFHISCEDVQAPEDSEAAETDTPITVPDDIHKRSRYMNISHRGSLKHKGSFSTGKKQHFTKVKIDKCSGGCPRFTNTIFKFGGSGLPI